MQFFWWGERNSLSTDIFLCLRLSGSGDDRWGLAWGVGTLVPTCWDISRPQPGVPICWDIDLPKNSIGFVWTLGYPYNHWLITICPYRMVPLSYKLVFKFYKPSLTIVISTINHRIQPLTTELLATLGAPSCMPLNVYYKLGISSETHNG
jgi:hypothetical protein